MKRKLNKVRVFLAILLVLLIIMLIGVFIFFKLAGPVNKTEVEKVFEVKSGENYNAIASRLKNDDLINNELVFKIYVKFMNPKGLEAGDYYLNPSMNTKEIINELSGGAVNSRETVQITFVEGKNMRYVISKIIEKFDITEEDILAKLKDEKYLDDLISKHWILSDEIKNPKLYYSLEGYLYPDTYDFYADATIEDIFERMISNLESKLSDYKDVISSSNYTFHEMLTLASIIEGEGKYLDDKKKIASVFYNRLNDGWSLGADITTYYAVKVDAWSRDLYNKEINDCNDYNTRAKCMAGKLPIGPVDNISVESIIAAINPEKTNYYYYVADVYGNTYFSKNSSEHSKTIAKLKQEGKWYEYN